MDAQNTTIATPAEILAGIQQRLVARKDARNNFGGYNYRSAESVLAAVKPLLAEAGATLIISDEIQLIGDRFYVKATATFTVCGDSITTTAFAREPLARKGMDEAQCTGSSSSYARKYALCGLFAIDDSRNDPDATNKHEAGTPLSDEDKGKFDACSTLDELDALAKSLIQRGSAREEVVAAYKSAKARISTATAKPTDGGAGK